MNGDWEYWLHNSLEGSNQAITQYTIYETSRYCHDQTKYKKKKKNKKICTKIWTICNRIPANNCFRQLELFREPIIIDGSLVG